MRPVALLLLAVLTASAEDWLAQGQEAFAKGDFIRAEAAFREHLKANPASAEALSNLAAVLSRREQHQEAIALYRRALEADPRLHQIHFNLAVAQLRALRYADASASLRSFLESFPNDLRARQLLGLCLVETGDFTAAIQELERVYAANPADASVVFSLAYAHARGGSAARGSQLLAKIESNPAQANLLRGLMHYREGRFAEAREAYEATLRYQPDLAPALAAVGRLYLLENKDEDAIRYLERAIQAAPQDAESTYQLGVLYQRNGKSEKGRELLLRSLTLRANYPDPYYQLARVEFEAKQFHRALEYIDKAVELLPRHEAVRFLRGRIFQALGEHQKAGIEFAEVRRIKAAVVERDRKRLEGEIPLGP